MLPGGAQQPEHLPLIRDRNHQDFAQLPFAYASYVVFDGNGKAKGVTSSNFNGKITRKEPLSGTYSVKANCTGTAIISDGTHYDQFIAPDGSKLTFVQTHPKRFVSAGFAPRGTAKRVGE